MEELFTCRNCIHNASQSLYLGCGHGYCLKFSTVLASPFSTTCKYLHRKDIPLFLSNLEEHNQEFNSFNFVVDYDTKEEKNCITYSEKFCWDNDSFDTLLDTTTKYYKCSPKWIFISNFFSGNDAREIITATSVSRRYMKSCGTWTSSYKFAYRAACKLEEGICINDKYLIDPNDDNKTLSIIDVFLNCISFVQEYAYIAGDENILSYIDTMMDTYFTLNLPKIIQLNQIAAKTLKAEMIRLAKEHNVYFPAPSD